MEGAKSIKQKKSDVKNVEVMKKKWDDENIQCANT